MDDVGTRALRRARQLQAHGMYPWPARLQAADEFNIYVGAINSAYAAEQRDHKLAKQVYKETHKESVTITVTVRKTEQLELFA